MTEMDGRKVLCVGLCCLDIVMVCESYPVEDSDQRCLSHRWQRGGNASNSCTIFSEFGVPCEILGTMSHDIGGQFMKANFKSFNIDCRHCRYYEEYESPTSVIWINAQNGSRTIVHSNKNMPEVELADFRKLDLRNYAWIHFECRPYYEEMKKMIENVRLWNSDKRNNSIKISVEVEKPRLELMEILGLGDIVFISKDFASTCGYVDMLSAAEALSKKLKPGGVLICAWAEKGACAKTVDGPLCMSPAYSPPVIVNTLGAGDTFVAATIISFLKGKSMQDAITFGCKVAGTKCGMHETSGLSQLCPFF